MSVQAPELFDLTDRVAIVTGGGSGIGQAIACGLAQCGARVACLDRREDGGLEKTVNLIVDSGGQAISIVADVTCRSDLDQAVVQTEKAFGALGIAVNAAGIANANACEDMEDDQYQTLMDINMKGVFLSCQAEAKAMLSQPRLYSNADEYPTRDD